MKTMNESKLDVAMQVRQFSQADLASQCGVSTSLIHLWLRQSRTGNGRLPSGEMLKNLELILMVQDGRSLFPIDWPNL